MSGRQQRVMLQPINVIFRHLQQQTRVSLWLYDNIEYRIEGKIIGFDEFMNVTLAEAEEVLCSAEKERKPLGRLLLKGDNIHEKPAIQLHFYVSRCSLIKASYMFAKTLIQPAM